MVTLMQCAVTRVAVFMTASRTWTPIPAAVDKPFTLVLQEQQSYGGAMGTLSVCIYQGSQLFFHAVQGLKIYKRKPDLAVKYWDLQTNQWCKIQVTLDSPSAFDNCIQLCAAAVGVEVINKEAERVPMVTAGQTTLPADDSELKKHLHSRMNDPEFVLLVRGYVYRSDEERNRVLTRLIYCDRWNELIRF